MKTIKLILKNQELKRKILFTLLLLLGLRILCSIPTPGVNGSYFKDLIQTNTSLGFLNTLTGNGLSSLSIMTLSVTPYITASIVMQLLGVAFPTLHELQKGMKDDRKKYERITICLGGVLGLVEGIAMAVNFGKQGMLISYTWYWVLLVALIWTIAAIGSSLVGKLISDKFIGNGMSLILLTNILSSYPSDIKNLYDVFIKGKTIGVAILAIVIILISVFLLFAFTSLIQDSEKNIIVNYSGKSFNGKNLVKNKMPIKLCPGGVVPIIFASSIVSSVAMLGTLLKANDNIFFKIFNTGMWFDIDNPFASIGVIFYVLMIFGFSYFYTDMVFNPKEVSDNIKKHGGNISGIRAGSSTSDYIKKQIKVMIAIGSIALSIIALIPIILSGVWGLARLSFLGTSILITVNVIIESRKIIQSNLLGTSYTYSGGIF